MARIVVAYDPEERLRLPDSGDYPPTMRFALVDLGEIGDAGEPETIARTVKKLVEMLLEQIEK